ncbi:hypothetical protein SAICODRAFT_173822 [Saitoella complicata NRRL Y-17804]|uniref:YitH/HolE acetyltransferase (GNAT) domain-containing protein n=1 Tax=Saitoella complicata (strain BCRC 22490 / CBS 7301 / JCM 7358 / NBRC 10748 / NRRL Y-17804) TaxID=698492 RepID=A0A0E9NKJ4_SAICN|nr:uncharacterized protein SAICODRAFT_173822 [Saitoella complicata NRRL Y-17804]ODQ50220.1 hypothetical protein SAICODRAFT_173822 [Saitoella complicata NRRL Y-17804]GAO50226.1 hypothetical protein G7K_4358-t1 [Saitoella complicata NRRL Y-17804]
MQGWLSTPNSAAYGIRSSGQLIGWAHIRPSVDGYRTGPLTASNSNPDHARLLFSSLLSFAASTNISTNTRKTRVMVHIMEEKQATLSREGDWEYLGMRFERMWRMTQGDIGKGEKGGSVRGDREMMWMAMDPGMG